MDRDNFSPPHCPKLLDRFGIYPLGNIWLRWISPRRVWREERLDLEEPTLIESYQGIKQLHSKIKRKSKQQEVEPYQLEEIGPKPCCEDLSLKSLSLATLPITWKPRYSSLATPWEGPSLWMEYDIPTKHSEVY